MISDYKKFIESAFLNYRKERYLELLKLRNEKNKIKESLNTENSFELRGYSAQLDLQLNWESRDITLGLVEKFLSKKIDSFDFAEEFKDRLLIIDEVKDILESNFILLSPQQKALEFGYLIDEMSGCCEFRLENGELMTNEYEIKLRNDIETIYHKMQEFIDK